MDGYSRAWLESRSGREAMAAKRRADERAQNRAKQYRKFWQLADEKARLLEFDPTKLSSTMFLSYMDYDRFSFPSDMFPNAEEIFPDWDSRIVKLTIYDSDYAEETQNVFNATEEEKDLKEAAFKRRVSHYFYEDVKDFDKEGVLDLFINYLKYSKDFDLKKMGSSSALSDEHIKEIIARSHPVYCNMMQLDLLLERPHVFSKEQVEEIVLQQWLVGSYDRYREMSMPTHMGMSPEDVEFRQKLNHVYQEIVGKSIYDLNFSGKSYFDMLLMKQQIDELIAEHREQFTDYMKKTLDFQLLMNKLKEDDNKNLADTPLNHQIIEFLDSIVTKENEHLLLSPNVSPLYVRHRILNHSLQDQNVIKQLAVYTFRDEIAVLLNRADSLDKETLKNVYQAAWLYARGNKSPDVLKSEYQALFGEDLENVKETWEGKYPLGASRFDILMKSKNVEILSQYHLDEFLQQPIDEIFQVIKDCHIYLHGYLNITDSSKNAFRLLDACVDKFGWKLISEKGPTQSLSEILIARYVAGKRIPEEIEALRSFNIRYSDLEELFEQNGDTLYQMKDLEFLITYDKKDKIDIINKRNEHFDNDDEKYKAFNQAVNAWASLNKDKQAEYFPYVRDFVKKYNIDFAKTEQQNDFVSGNMLHFMLLEYGQNPKIDKKMLGIFLEKARRNEDIFDEDIKKLNQLGYSFKTNFAYNLIEYETKRRAVNINLNVRDWSRYDFETPFLLDRPFHHSSGSHTTFLNEALQYGEKEAVVVALNNGASPFTKAGFFRDKFMAMPFNMFFNRELKDNNVAKLQNFMNYIAANLNEDKKGVLKDIWTSLGQKLRADSRVQEIITQANHVFSSRDFAQEKIDKELKLKAEEERRKQEAEQARIEAERRRAEEERIAEERRIAAEKRRHDYDLAFLQKNILASLVDIVSMDNKDIVQNIAQYLEENKSKLDVIPNADELSAIKEAAFEYKERETRLKQQRDEEKRQNMKKAIRKAIEAQEKETKTILSPKEVGEFITKYFEKDTEAQPFINSTVEIFSEEAKEKLEIQNKLSKVERVAADKLIDFFEDDDTHGYQYFNSVGKERRNQGYSYVAMDVMRELKLPFPEGDFWEAPQKEKELFEEVKDAVIDLVKRMQERGYPKEKDISLEESYYNFLANIVGDDLDESDVDEKAQTETHTTKKGETIMNSFDALAALKDKFNSGK